MGARGPAPKSAAELRRRGSRRAKARAAGLELPVAAPSPPKWLDTEARAEWNRVAPILVERGSIASVDRAALAVLCTSWSEYHALGRVLDSAEFEHGSQERKRVSAERNEAYTRWAAMAQRFGLTPADRARVPGKPPDEGKDADRGLGKYQVQPLRVAR